MAVTSLEIRARQPYADGQHFGEAGAYERLDGIIEFAVAPEVAANQAIVDLDRAARDEAGRVRFRADFCLLQPVDPARGSRRLLFEVLNRGRKLMPRSLHHAAPEAEPTYAIDPGDGLLLRRGWSLVWCGWQWDVIRSEALMGLEAPEALDDNGQPLNGQIICRFQPNTFSREKLLADRVHQPYPTPDLDDPEATLTVADWPFGPPTTIPRDRWRFARDSDSGPVPADTHVWLADGFEPGKVYDLIYRTRRCPVAGTGLLAMRDTVAFLRHGDADAGNPAAGRLDHTYAFGASQSGRFLRHFLHLGLNLDESGRQVFDGILCHIAGAWRGEFNHRFAQPSVMNTHGLGHRPPFTFDPHGDQPGLLDRQRDLGGLPRIFSVNTAAEYWRGDSSLFHIDEYGDGDITLPGEVRAYLLASAQHGMGALPLADHNPNDDVRGAHPYNALDYGPLLRAALINLDAWVTAGTEPPPSAVPRLADGTAVTASSVVETYRRIPGATIPDPARLPNQRRLDLGPEADAGIGHYPASVGDPYRVFVSAVDSDGNEVAGVRMPDLAVPVATYAGWNPRHPTIGDPGQILPMVGSTFPFARTAEERAATDDPRPAIAERYRDRDDYLTRIHAAAEALVAQRYLLAEDIPLAMALAAERYDAFVGKGPS